MLLPSRQNRWPSGKNLDWDAQRIGTGKSASIRRPHGTVTWLYNGLSAELEFPRGRNPFWKNRAFRTSVQKLLSLPTDVVNDNGR